MLQGFAFVGMLRTFVSASTNRITLWIWIPSDTWLSINNATCWTTNMHRWSVRIVRGPYYSNFDWTTRQWMETLLARHRILYSACWSAILVQEAFGYFRCVAEADNSLPQYAMAICKEAETWEVNIKKICTELFAFVLLFCQSFADDWISYM